MSPLDRYQVCALVDMATRAASQSNADGRDLLAGMLDVLSDGLTPDEISCQYDGNPSDLRRIAKALESLGRPANPFVLAAAAIGDPCP